MGLIARLRRLVGPLLPAKVVRLEPEQEYAQAVPVGTCAACDGTVLYSRRARLASCACGASSIPRAFLDAKQREAVDR